MNVKLLLDENISPKVGEILCKEDGVDACGVRGRGLLAATDAEVLEKAFGEERVLVTKNVGDFEKLARTRELHAGIVLLEDGGLGRDLRIPPALGRAFRRDLGTNSDSTWARIPEHLGSHSDAPGHRFRRTWAEGSPGLRPARRSA